MAYDEGLARRVRKIIGKQPMVLEKKMFGGIGFIARGNMACGVLNEDLLVRVGVEDHAEALAQPHVRIFDMTGRPMKGWVMVGPKGLETDEDLERWVHQALGFALELPSR